MFRTHRQSAYTLMELVIASSSAAILMGGMGSALYVASQSLDMAEGRTVSKGTMSRAVDQIVRDLEHARQFTERTSTAMTFTVPDRDGDGLPETIRYAWSGTVGDPLTYELNESDGGTLLDEVESLNFDYLTRTIAGSSLLDTDSSVLVFVTQDSTVSTQEQIRINQLESWGYTVNTVQDSADSSEYATASTDAIGLYVSGEVTSSSTATRLIELGLGAVIESHEVAQDLGVIANLQYVTQDTLRVEAPHYITEDSGVGDFAVLDTAQPLLYDLEYSTDASVVAKCNTSGTSYVACFYAVSAGDTLIGGATAAARYVVLPWGSNSFDGAELNTQGWSYVERAVTWATDINTADTSTVQYMDFVEAKLDTDDTGLTLSSLSTAAEGDLLVMAVAIDGASTVLTEFTPPSGWTLLAASNSSDSASLLVYWKLCTASEPSSYSMSWGSSTETAYAWLMRFTNVDATNPIHASSVDVGKLQAPQAPSATTTVDNCLVLRLGAFDNASVTTDSPGITGHTAVTADSSNAGSDDVSGAAAYAYQTSAGSTGTADFALESKEYYVTVTIAIAPDTGSE